MLASTEQYYPRAYARVSDFEGSMLELYASACICDSLYIGKEAA